MSFSPPNSVHRLYLLLCIQIHTKTFRLIIFPYVSSSFFRSLIFISMLIQDLQLFEEIQWVGNGPPVAEPKCGFRGQKCISK